MPAFQNQRQPATSRDAQGYAPARGGSPAGRGNAFLQDQLRARQAQEGPGLAEGQEAAQLAAGDAIPSQYASESEVWRMGYLDGVAQARGGLANIGGDARTQGALSQAATATGVAEDDLTAMAIIESTGNRNIGTNAYGYTGLMQMGRDAATDLGMSYSKMKGGANVDNNALAGARYWKLNEQRLDEDIPRDPLHMYLAHQQGAGGTNQLMDTLATNPGKAAHGAQKNNLPGHVRQARGKSLTQQDFYDYWAGKMQAIQDAIAASKDRPA